MNSEFCVLHFSYIHARLYIFGSGVRSFVCLLQKYFFTRKRRSRERERASLRHYPRAAASLLRNIRNEACARAHTMFKALPVIFRGVSAYLYRPRFRFYITSHRYAPRGTPADCAIFSHDKRAINFCETALAPPFMRARVRPSLRLPS